MFPCKSEFLAPPEKLEELSFLQVKDRPDWAAPAPLEWTGIALH